jgi:alpha-ketoglutarate-dependent taurine dioxygenase
MPYSAKQLKNLIERGDTMIETLPMYEKFGTTIAAKDSLDLFELSIETIISLFKESGVLLFSGFDVDTNKFEQFSNLFGLDYMKYIGGAHNRKTINENGDKTILSVGFYRNPNQQDTFELPLHADMFYTKSRPVFIWFYCVNPAETNGETTVCDGVEVYKELSEKALNLFKTKRLKYIRYYPNGIWQERFQTDDLNIVEKLCKESDLNLKVDSSTQLITTEFIQSALVKTKWSNQDAFVNSILSVEWQEAHGKTDSLIRLEDDSKIPEEVMQEIKEVTSRLTRKISWNKGDIVMMDNTRMLHGRKAFSDQKREVYIRMCRSVDW